MNQEPNLSQPTGRSASNTRIAVRTLVPIFVVLAALIFAYFYAGRISDAVAARNFTPTQQIASVDQRLKLTGRGTDIFYASAPLVEQQKEFNNNCKTEEHTAAILGCYYRNRIYLFDIDNKELDGTMEVTAAHEMLHAAYGRLSIFERPRIDALLKAEYAKLKDSNATLRETMAYYKQAEPNDLVNELHSILGTTVAQLSPELEQYYAQYFSDRQAVVTLNQKYVAVFTEVNKQAEELSVKITALKPQIDSELAAYDTTRTQLEADIASFNQRAASGAFTSQAQFNRERSALLARSSQLDVQREAVNAKVDEYNTYVEQLNKLSVRIGELNKSINGAKATEGISG